MRPRMTALEDQDFRSLRFLPAPTVSWTDTGGDLVLFDQESGCYHALNATSSTIWRLLSQGASSIEIAERLTARFEVEPAILRDAIDEFLGNMHERRLVVDAA